MQHQTDQQPMPKRHDAAPREYATPVVRDLGSLTELTLSGHGPLSDAFGGVAGGGS